jgi:hypothetical protein
MFRLILISMLLLASAGATPDVRQPPLSGQGISLAELTTRADVVVLAQARDTDYAYRREFPLEGSAFLRVLIAYKADKPLGIIEVYEQGLHAHECYFPNPTVFEEGRRYLLFLQQDKSKPERYRGLAQGCALDVLVDRNNRYVVRLPITGIELTDPLLELGKKFEFADAYAMENDESLPAQKRDALLAAGWIEPRGDRYIYTHGVELSTVRKLMTGNTATAVDQR